MPGSRFLCIAAVLTFNGPCFACLRGDLAIGDRFKAQISANDRGDENIVDSVRQVSRMQRIERQH